MNINGGDDRIMRHPDFDDIKEIPEVDLIISKRGKTIRTSTEI